MRRTLLTSIALMTVLLSNSVFAQPGNSGPDRMRDGRFNMTTKLDLTDDQQTQIDKLRLDHQKEVSPLRDELHSLQNAYKLMIIDDKASKADLQKQLAKMSDARSELGLKKALHQREVRSLLTDEQKVKFDQHVISGRGQRGMKSGKRPNKGNQKPGNRAR